MRKESVMKNICHTILSPWVTEDFVGIKWVLGRNLEKRYKEAMQWVKANR